MARSSTRTTSPGRSCRSRTASTATLQQGRQHADAQGDAEQPAVGGDCPRAGDEGVEPKVGEGCKLHVINADSRFEAAGVLDVNRDGKLDILSGGFWYEAPDWKKHFVREIKEEGQLLLRFRQPADGRGWRRLDGHRRGGLAQQDGVLGSQPRQDRRAVAGVRDRYAGQHGDRDGRATSTATNSSTSCPTS